MGKYKRPSIGTEIIWKILKLEASYYMISGSNADHSVGKKPVKE